MVTTYVQVLVLVLYLFILIAVVTFLVALRANKGSGGRSVTENAGGVDEKLAWLESNTVFWTKGITESVHYAGVVDRVYGIVLPQRKAGFEKRLATSGLLNDIWMLKAMPKDTLPYPELFKIGLIDKRFFEAYENKGRSACHLSHLACIHHFMQSNLENALILEDDSVLLNEKTADHVKTIYDEAKKSYPNFNIIYYGYNYEPSKISPDDPNPTKHAPGSVWKLTRPFGRHAYLITKSSAKVIMDGTITLNNPGDVKYTQLMKEGKLIAVGPAIRLFNQDQCEYKTTLGNDTGRCIPPQFDNRGK